MSKPFEPESAGAAIWEAMLEVYAGAVSNDRARIDVNIHPSCTFWDTDSMPLVHGLVELDAVRDRRPASDSDAPLPTITAIEPEVRVWGDTALLLHWFEYRDGSAEQGMRVRNTSVWRRSASAGRWLLVHNHEDVMATPYWPAPLR